jgi:hypothetical protein
MMHSYFAIDTTDAVLFRNFFSINYCNLIKIVSTVFSKTRSFFFCEAHLKDSYFWTSNDHILRKLT